MRVITIHAVVALCACAAAGCLPAAVCVPNESRVCPCPDGRTAAEICNGQGTAYLACSCANLPALDAAAPDTAPGTDATQVDTPVTGDSTLTEGVADTSVPVPDGGLSTGRRCTMESGCPAPPSSPGEMSCDTDYPGGWCTRTCTQNASQTVEASQCGGAGTTCLTLGDPGAMPTSRCTRACTPAGPGPSGCDAQQICTGWFTSHAGLRPDSPGCFPWCRDDSVCGGTFPVCDRRVGTCVSANPETLPTARADGMPCQPVAAGRLSPECRSGLCMSVNASGVHGLCGSFIDRRTTPRCLDEPDRMHMVSATGDDLALCIWRTCATSCDCTAPSVCVHATAVGAPQVCRWPDTAAGETVVPAPSGGCPGINAGVPDAALPVDAPVPTDRGPDVRDVSTPEAGACTGLSLGGIGVPAGTVATASRTYSTALARYAIDGDLATGWSSGTYMGWLRLDFPTPVRITGLRIATGALPATNEDFTITEGGGSTIGSATLPVPQGTMPTMPPLLAPIPVTPGAYSSVTITINGRASWVAVSEVSLLTPECPAH